MYIRINRTTYWLTDVINATAREGSHGFCYVSGIRAMMGSSCTVKFDLFLEQGNTVEFCNEYGYCTGEEYIIDGIDKMNMVLELMKTRFALSKI